MDQIPLIIDTLNDAIRDTARSIGVKEVARLLWPTKPADEAARHLNDCLNPERPHKLSGEEILAIAKLGRERGIHLIIAFANMDAGYSPPQPVDPEDQRAELQRRFNESVASLERLAAQIKRAR